MYFFGDIAAIGDTLVTSDS